MSYSSLQLPASAAATVARIGQKYGKTEKQVLLKWQLQHNISVIPRSTNPVHIKENIQLFDWELNSDELTEISLLKVH
jgi:diketogulonate reductase-like aldo/keto reductase